MPVRRRPNSDGDGGAESNGWQTESVMTQAVASGWWSDGWRLIGIQNLLPSWDGNVNGTSPARDPAVARPDDPPFATMDH